MLLTSSASPGNQHRGDVPSSQLPREVATSSNFSAFILGGLLRVTLRTLLLEELPSLALCVPTGVALPNFLKARQVLAGWGDALKSRDLLGVAASATASVLVLWPQATFAQSNSGSASQSLPSVVVTSPEKRTGDDDAAQPAPGRAKRGRFPKAPTGREAPAAAVVENPRGAVQGYVAGRSMAGTKTNTPIMETPQSLSVIGSEQIRDQKPGKFDEILRYTPGVLGGTSVPIRATTGS